MATEPTSPLVGILWAGIRHKGLLLRVWEVRWLDRIERELNRRR
jgi:hypothetical protein